MHRRGRQEDDNVVSGSRKGVVRMKSQWEESSKCMERGR